MSKKVHRAETGLIIKAKGTEETLQRQNEILFQYMFQSKGSYGRTNALPKAVHTLISGTCQSVTSPGKKYFTDVKRNEC